MLGKRTSRRDAGGVGRGAATHLLALFLGLALGSVVSNFGLGPPGYYYSFGSSTGESSSSPSRPDGGREGGGSDTVASGGGPVHRQLPGTYAEWLPTVMPPSLLAEYGTPGALPFNLTMSVLRRSRPVVGNTERVRGFLRKLRGGRCTASIMLGGSVTAGHNAGGPGVAYVREKRDESLFGNRVTDSSPSSRASFSFSLPSLSSSEKKRSAQAVHGLPQRAVPLHRRRDRSGRARLQDDDRRELHVARYVLLVHIEPRPGRPGPRGVQRERRLHAREGQPRARAGGQGAVGRDAR